MYANHQMPSNFASERLKQSRGVKIEHISFCYMPKIYWVKL